MRPLASHDGPRTEWKQEGCRATSLTNRRPHRASDGPESGVDPVLIGRHSEVRGPRQRGWWRLAKGQSWAIVLRGEAGVGKTALLNYLFNRARA